MTLQPLSAYTPAPELSLLTHDYGDYLQGLAAEDKAALLGVLGTYFHGLLGTFPDDENYSELIDGYLDYPIACSEQVHYVVTILSCITHPDLLAVTAAIAAYLAAEAGDACP